MFKRFHQKSHNNSKTAINQTTYQQINKNKSSLHTKYSERHKNKIQTVSQENSSANLEMIKTENFIFQGFIKNNQKHGEGVMMLINGTIVFGTWENDLLEGRALIFTSLGCKIMAHFILGKFNGWTLALYKERLVKCIQFYQNYLDSEKITYDDKQKLWISAKCTYDGKLVSINHVEKGHLMELPSFLQSQELKELISRYIVNRENFVMFQHIQCIENGVNSSYVGFADEEKKPWGLGLIYTDKEIYCGNFFQGVLEHYGRMIFQNGEIYHGQMLGGVFWGRGIYYSPAKNQTHILSTNEHEHTIQKQLQGYYMIKIEPLLGGASNNSSTGIKGLTLKIIQQSFEPYYIKQYASKKRNVRNEESNNSEYGHSQDMDRSIHVHDHKGNQRTSSMPPDKIKPQEKWLKFNQQDNPNNLYKRTFSLDKREAAMKKKEQIQIKVKPSNQYQSIQIKQNTNHEQAEDFLKRAPPQTKLMQQIKFNNDGFKIKKQPKSLQMDEIAPRNSNTLLQQPPKKGENIMVSKITQQSHSQSSRISNDSMKLQKLIQKGKSYRKKIFY